MWLVMDIGWMESGSSSVVGVFADKLKADAIAAECSKKYDDGHNVFQVYELQEPEKIADKYGSLDL